MNDRGKSVFPGNEASQGRKHQVELMSRMNNYFDRWYKAIGQRRSRRWFNPGRPIGPDKLDEIRKVCTSFRPFNGARAELVTESPDRVFKGAVGSYGKIKGASSFVAFIGDISSPFVHEQVGYTGEGILLEATASGLSTCWVGGFFRPEVVTSLVKIQKNERVLAVSPVGYSRQAASLEEKIMTGFGLTHRRTRTSKMVTGLDKNVWPEWIKTSLEAARLAPSAINRQPWGFHIEKESIAVLVRTSGPEFNISKRLDCGIAMLHLEVAAFQCGIKGNWEFLESPRVALFTI